MSSLESRYSGIYGHLHVVTPPRAQLLIDYTAAGWSHPDQSRLCCAICDARRRRSGSSVRNQQGTEIGEMTRLTVGFTDDYLKKVEEDRDSPRRRMGAVISCRPSMTMSKRSRSAKLTLQGDLTSDFNNFTDCNKFTLQCNDILAKLFFRENRLHCFTSVPVVCSWTLGPTGILPRILRILRHLL